MFDITRIEEIKREPERFRLLESIPLSADDSYPIELHKTVGDEIKLALVDLETTGFVAGLHEIIEAGIVQVGYSPSIRKITTVYEIFSQFEQPANQISEEITAITGITNEMVEGHTIDDAHAARLINSSAMLIAHNAAFDRSHWDLRFKGMADRVWACSIKDIDWYQLGFESAKLEYLLLKNGYFYSGHRAATDCLAMVQLFNTVPNALHELLQRAKTTSVKIIGKGIKYSDRETVKARGYRWDVNEKHWWTVIPENDFAKEKAYLDDLCGPNNGNLFIEILANERYGADSAK